MIKMLRICKRKKNKKKACQEVKKACQKLEVKLEANFFWQENRGISEPLDRLESKTSFSFMMQCLLD